MGGPRTGAGLWRGCLAAGLVTALTGCAGPHSTAGAGHGTTGATSRAALTVADLTGYRRGVARETALLNHRLESGGAEQAGDASPVAEAARVAGLTPDRYRSVGAAVDSLLRARPGRRPPGVDATVFASPQAAETFGRMAGELDSFRVELIVLRVRLTGLGHPRD